MTEGIDSEFDEEDIDEEDATEGVVYDDETLGEKEENVIVIGAKVGNSRTSSDPSAVKGQPPNQQQRRSQKNLDWPGRNTGLAFFLGLLCYYFFARFRGSKYRCRGEFDETQVHHTGSWQPNPASNQIG